MLRRSALVPDRKRGFAADWIFSTNGGSRLARSAITTCLSAARKDRVQTRSRQHVGEDVERMAIGFGIRSRQVELECG